MPNLKKLLASDIRYECGENSFVRGQHYYVRNQVLDLGIKSEGALFVQLAASVKGSEKQPYKQSIRITWKADYSSAKIDGSCSCPMGYNCKHVAAACLKYQNSNLPQPAQDANCLDWLDHLEEPGAKEDISDQEFIAYILVPAPVKNEFSFDFLITKAKKSGGFAKGRKITLDSLRYSFANHYSYHYAKYIHSQDHGIIKLLYSLDTSAGKPLLTGAAGHLSLTQIIQTGRLFWQDLEHAPLTPGPDRDLRFGWRQSGDSDYRLTAAPEPDGLLLLTDPPFYLDPGLGQIGPVNDSGLGINRLKKILNAPPVPANYADEFSLRLTIDHPDLPLPAPKQVELTELDQLTPSPRIVLSGGNYAQRYLHFIAVRFDYGDITLPAKKTEHHTVLKTGQGLVRITRNLDAERASIQRLAEHGFVALDHGNPSVMDFLMHSPSQNQFGDGAARWADFLRDTVPALEQEGWRVETDDSFKLNF